MSGIFRRELYLRLSFRVLFGATGRWLAILAAPLLQLGQSATAQSYGLESRQPVGPFLGHALPAREQSAAWALVEAFPNLTFNNPVCLTPEPGTNRLYICEQNGLIYFFDNSSSTTTKTLFLNLSPVTQGHEDHGVLGFAFHPDYGIPTSTNRGYVYVYYTYSPSPTPTPDYSTRSYNRLSRFTVPDGSLVADQNSELILINQYNEDWWHNGGGMFFGPDGFLYLSMGDEGGVNDAFNNSQKINSALFSGVLRIDVDMDPTRSHPIRRQPSNGGTLPNGSGWINSFSANYYIPNDNPWLDEGGSILEEFYAIGLRSPHRMTFDPPTGRIWLGDVGQATIEEVNLIEKGGNYQWAYREGNINGPKPKPNPLIGIDQPPIHAYGRTEGNCVIGGYVYRGIEHAAYLSGRYIFGDNGSGRIWALDYNGQGNPTVTYLCNTPPGESYSNLSSFGVDQNNELYVLVVGSQRKIYKLARTTEFGQPPPVLLSQIGAFTNLSTLAPNPALIPYTVNAPLWSDNAEKWRWLAVPNDGAPYGANERINFAVNSPWSFPTGTVFVKHFELPINDTNAAIRKRLETRFLARGTNGNWYGLTYKWRADESDADLLPGSLEEAIAITTPTGVRTQVWYYPSRQDCLTCHTPNAGSVLGPRTSQMNGDFTYPGTGVADNQLRTLNQLSLFNTNLVETNLPAYPRTANLADSNASLELRVRSYLDANCAHCHRPNGTRANFDARFETPLSAQGIVGAIPNDSLNIPGARIIAPASPTQSVMHWRLNSLANIKMPPLAKNRVDEEAVAILTQWINSLPPTTIPPPPWNHQDIGAVGVAGDATYSSGTFSVRASGVDIYGTADSFHFVHRPLVGNGTITARVISLENTEPWALAGVMIRENLTAGSRHAFVGCTAQNGISFSRRSTTGGTTLYTAGAAVPAPYWLRLTRNGNTLTAFSSSDSINWTQVGSQSISMTTTVYAGLVYSSHVNSLLGTATFDNVLLTGPNVNNPPEITFIPAQTTSVNTVAGPIAFSIGDVETPATDLTLTATSSVPSLVAPHNIIFGGANSNRTVSITPQPDAFGLTTLTLSVSDGTNTAASTFTLEVLPANNPPLAAPDLITRWLSQGVAVPYSNLTTNDTDADGDELAITSIAAISTAGATIIATNNWLFYAPVFGQTNEDNFTYVISDAQGGSATGLVTVAVMPDPAWNDLLNIGTTGGAELSLQLTGLPGFSYTIQSSDTLDPADWQKLTAVTADESGMIELVVPNPGTAGPRFYRGVRGVMP